MSATVSISTLGPLEVLVDGKKVELTAIPAKILCYLAVADGLTIPTEGLLDLLYPDGGQGPTTVRSNIRHLRAALEPFGKHVVDTHRDQGYRLDVSNTDIEVVVAERQFRDACSAAAARDRSNDDEVENLLRDALALWRDADPYRELADEIEFQGHRAELRQRRSWCERRLVDCLLATGRIDEMVPKLETHVRTEPTDQTAVAQLMRAYAAIGRPDDATRVYQRLVDHLRSGPGSSPLQELRELDGQILRHDPDVVGLAAGVSITPGSGVVDLRDHKNRSHEVPGADDIHDRASSFEPPAPFTPLVGRGAELKVLQDAVAQHRLVTITGPVGAGKSRLAAELADQATSPIRWCQLASIDSADADSAAGLLRDVGAEAEPGVETLFVLDNIEHVASSVAAEAVALLERGTGISLVVTSRTPLHIPGEKVIALGPLAARSEDESGPSEAAQLFVARSAGPIGAGDAALVDEICELVGRLPLLIELAAARTRSMSLADIERSLADEGLPLIDLTAAASGHRERIDHALEWSCEALEPAARRVLEAASVFTGSFTIVDLADLLDADRDDVGSAVLALADRSLISTQQRGRSLTLLAPVRSFLRAGLADAARASLQDRHAAWVISQLAEEVNPRVVVRLSREIGPAARHLFESGEYGRALELLDRVCMWVSWVDTPLNVEPWLDRMVAHGGDSADVATDLRAMLCFVGGDYQRLGGLTEAAVAVASQSRNQRRQARAHLLAGLASMLVGEMAESAEHIDVARGIGEGLDDYWLLGWSDSIDGFRHRRSGDHEAAEAACLRAIEIFDDLADLHGGALSRLTLGRLHGTGGDAEIGLAWVDDGVRMADKLGDPLIGGLGRLYTGQVLFEQGHGDAAVASILAAIRLMARRPHRPVMASALDHAAAILAERGMPAATVRIHGFTAGYYQRSSEHPPARTSDVLDKARSELGDSSFDRKFKLGGNMTLDETIEFLIESLDAAQPSGPGPVDETDDGLG